MTLEDLAIVEQHIFEKADDRYVMQSDCNDRQSTVYSELAKDDKRIDIIAHDFGTIKKLLWLVAGACVTSAVTAVFGVIFH
jgi:hypothetical protein